MVDHSSLAVWSPGERPCIGERPGDDSQYGRDRTESKIATYVFSSEPDSDDSESESITSSSQTDVSTATEGYRGDSESHAAFVSDSSGRMLSDTRGIAHDSDISVTETGVFNGIFGSTSDSSDLSPRDRYSDSSDILANDSLSDGLGESGLILSRKGSDDVFEDETDKTKHCKSYIARYLPDTVHKSTAPEMTKPLKSNSLLFYQVDTAKDSQPSLIPRKTVAARNSKLDNKAMLSNGNVDVKENSGAVPVKYRSDCKLYLNGSDNKDEIKYNTNIFRGNIQRILDAKSVNATNPSTKSLKCDLGETNSVKGTRKSSENSFDKSSANGQNSRKGSSEMNMAPSEVAPPRRSSLVSGFSFPSSMRRINSGGKLLNKETESSGSRPNSMRTSNVGQDPSMIPKLDLNMKSVSCALSTQSYKGNLFPAELSRKESRVPRLNGSISNGRNLNVFPESKSQVDRTKLRGRSSSVVVTTLCNIDRRETGKIGKTNADREVDKQNQNAGLNRQCRSLSLDDILDGGHTSTSQLNRHYQNGYANELERAPTKIESLRRGINMVAGNLDKSCDGDTSKGTLKARIGQDRKIGLGKWTNEFSSNQDISRDNPSVNCDSKNVNAKRRTRRNHRQETVTGYDMVSGKKFTYAKADINGHKPETNCHHRGKPEALKDPMEHHLRAFSQAVSRSDATEDVDVDTLSSVGSEPVKDNWILKPMKNSEESTEKETIELTSVTPDRRRSVTRTKSEAGHFVSEKVSNSNAQKESHFSRQEKLGLNRSKTFSLTNSEFVEVDKVKKKIEELRSSKIELSTVSKLAGFFWSKKEKEKDESLDFCQNKTHDICRYLQKYRSESVISAENKASRDPSKKRKNCKLQGTPPGNDYELQVMEEKRSYPLSELHVDLHRQRRKQRRRYRSNNRPASEIKDSVFGDLTESHTDIVLERLRRKSPFLKLKDINSSNSERAIDRWKNSSERLTPQLRRRRESGVSHDVQKRCESLEQGGESLNGTPVLPAKAKNGKEGSRELSSDTTPGLTRKDYHGSVDNFLDQESPKQPFDRQQSSRRSIRRNHAMRRSKRPGDIEIPNPEDISNDDHGLVYASMRRRGSYDGLDQRPKSLHKTLSVPNMSLKPKLDLCAKSVSPARRTFESASGSNTSSPDPTPKKSVLGFFQSFSRADKETPRKPLKRSQTFTHTFDKAYRAKFRSTDQSYSNSTSSEPWNTTIDELEKNPTVGRKVSFLRKLASEQIDDLSHSVENIQDHFRTAVKRIQTSFDEEKVMEPDRRQSSSSDTTWNRKQTEGDSVQGEENRSEELVARLLEDAMESDVHTKVDGLEDSNRSTFEYDKYGFCKTALHDEEENHLVARAKRLQKDSEDIVSTMDGSDHLTSLRVKWENYFVNIGTRELLPCLDLKLLIRQGIPYDLKERVWKAVINFRVRTMRSEVGPRYYSDLLSTKGIKRYNPAAKQIELDLLRTLPNNKHYESLQGEGIPRLRRILQAYSCHNPVVGYCQGLNRLVAIALLFLNEEDAFWCLVCIVDFIMPQDYYSKTLIASQADQRVLKDLINEKLPRLYAHLEGCEVDMSLFTFNWFLTVFVDNIPVETFLRIWDSFLYEGTKVLFRFAIAFFKYAEEDILVLKDHMAIHKYLRVLGETMLDCRRLSQIAFHDLNPFPMKNIKTKRSYYLLQVKHELEELDAIREDFKSREIPSDRQEFWSDDDLD